MKIRNILLLIPIVYILILLQTSFLVHFNILGRTINLVLILIIFISLFEKEKNIISLALFLALISGLLLDIFSNRYLGFNIVILSILVIFIKLIMKNYVRIPLSRKI